MRTLRIAVLACVAFTACGVVDESVHKRNAGSAEEGAIPFGFTPVAVPKATCGAGDQPETGLQGEVPIADVASGRSRSGYWCNMRLVGHNDIDGMGLTSEGWTITWYKDCAYALTDFEKALAVIDASDPTNPRLVDILPNPVAQTHEGMHANAARGILVLHSGVSFGRVPTSTSKLAIYDLEPDCTQPKLVNIYDTGVYLRNDIHSGALTGDGKTFYATETISGPCLTIIDLADLAHPTTIAATIVGGSYGATYACHDVDVSRDGTRVYAGSIGDVVTGVLLPTQNLDASAHPTNPNGLEILDTSDIQFRRPNPQIKRLGTLNSGRGHTQAVARVAGRRYVFQAMEATCAGGTAMIVDVTDELNPVRVADLALEYQVDPRCNEEDPQNGNRTGDPLFDALDYQTHYFGFDSADDSAGAHEPENVTVAFLSAYWSGLRAFDVSDPYHPKEIGYYNPPVPEGSDKPHDSVRTWIRYRPETGHIWFGSVVNGFNVVEFTNGAGPATGE